MNQARRLTIALLATVIIAIGILLSMPFIPGPGIVVLLLGLTLLAREFRWADDLLNKLKERWYELKQKVVGKE